MKLRILAAILTLSMISIALPSAVAVTSKLSLSVIQTPSTSETLVTFYGTLKPAKSGIVIKIQIKSAGTWKTTRFLAKTTKAGTWKITALATAMDSKVTYRAIAVNAGKKIYSGPRTITIKQLPEFSETDPALVIGEFGPGGRIHGADISRWQHPNDKTIDFVKMYDAGIRFVMIKASDTRDDADALSIAPLRQLAFIPVFITTQSCLMLTMTKLSFAMQLRRRKKRYGVLHPLAATPNVICLML